MEIIEYKRCKPRDTHQYLTWAIDPGIDGAKHPPAKRGVERYLAVYLDIDGSNISANRSEPPIAQSRFKSSIFEMNGMDYQFIMWEIWKRTG